MNTRVLVPSAFHPSPTRPAVASKELMRYMEYVPCGLEALHTTTQSVMFHHEFRHIVSVTNSIHGAELAFWGTPASCVLAAWAQRDNMSSLCLFFREVSIEGGTIVYEGIIGVCGEKGAGRLWLWRYDSNEL